MSSFWKLIIIYIFLLYQESESVIAVRKFVYQKDMSEHCRRRVVPSIFLGRHVVEANSQILHFSRMDLPYSCFISVRTESGSNIIFFIQLLSEDSLSGACSESGNQILVYEMGETFGGYWGPLPETLVRNKQKESTKYYTLKTTQPTTTTTENSSDEEFAKNGTEDIKFAAQTPSQSQQSEDTGDFITMELPIVNISGQLMPGKEQPKDFDIDEAFDLIYDVAPRRGEQYKTSILPLVQFSISKQEGPQRSGDTGPRYQLDYDLDTFTPDSRLTYPSIQVTSTKKRKYKYGYNANRRVNYNKNNRLFAARKPSLYLKQRFTTSPQTLQQITSWHDINSIANHSLKTDVQQIPMTTNETNVEHNESWAYINNLMETLNRNTESDNLEKVEESLNVSNLLHNISNMQHKSSAYLAPENPLNSDLARIEPKSVLANFTLSSVVSQQASSTISDSTNYDRDNNITEIIMTDSKSEEEVSVENIIPQTLQTANVTLEDVHSDGQTNLSIINKFIDKTNVDPELNADMEYAPFNNTNLQPINYSTKSILENTDGLKNITHSIQIQNSTMKSPQSLTTSTVDHESWENVVQAASVMAVILNHTYDNNSKNISNGRMQLNMTKHRRSIVRKKRFIYAVPIEDARPHNLTTRMTKPTTTMSTYKVADLQDFAQLAELQDDEMHGRVALRYLRHYVGPVMFNVCDYHEVKDRQVFLFNSSRIVIAITNFTMDRTTIVVTPARTLLNAEARCSSAHLECQVSGTRVCIDSMSACDGVPNCGTYDIYDEDRLMCGAAVGLQHNVCLAAFTFLAVLLTMLYTVHYWLKRCVPKVSDAFFIYANGAENILYLDTIMRSPNDLNDGSKMVYHGNIFDDDIIYTNASDITKPTNKFINFIWKLPGFRLLKGKRKREYQEDIMNNDFYSNNMEPRKIYSFTEIEIQRMIGKESTDAAIQTGESLEMQYLKRIKKKEGIKVPTEITFNKYAKRTPTVSKHNDELGTLKNTSRPQSEKDELSILNFFREIRSESIGSASFEARRKLTEKIKFDVAEEEKELRSHMYEPQGLYKAGPSGRLKYDISSQTLPRVSSGQVRKHLRFEEEPTTIPSEEYKEVQIEGKESRGRRSTSFVGGKLWRAFDLNNFAEDNDESTSTGREQRSFWGGNKKGKKSKKKTHVPLR